MSNVGQELKQRRQEMNLSLTEVELQTKLRGKFLTTLESGDYDNLPNDIYSRGFVQHYGNFLGLDGAALAEKYIAERGGLAAADTSAPKMAAAPRLVITGRLTAALIGLTVIFGIVGYLVWQFSALAAAPRLTITSPGPDQTVTGSTTTVTGRTTPGSDVSIDDIKVSTDPEGNFSSKLALQDGVNTVRIVATSKLGKTTTLSRSILARVPSTAQGTSTVPAEPFDGVAVLVAVDATVAAVVIIDGKEAYRGLILEGSGRLFQGASEVIITTSNAGATKVTVTNSVAAGKVINSLGREGEVRKDQSFAKDTVIP